MRVLLSGVRLAALVAMLFIAPKPGFAQIAPGPYEYLPFQDGFIVEAFKDLETNVVNAISDWSGYSGNTWVSPNAYNDHTGTDVSVQTGTPLFAAVSGTVTQVATNFARDDHSTQFGNFVRIAVDNPAPNGEALDLLYLHMLQVNVVVNQRVNVGDFVGLSDNTGNSTSEHVHFQSELRGALPTCPFYWGHFKYPIVFNQNGTFQIGRIIKITADSTPIRTNRFDTSLQISTAHRDQLYFSSYPKRGYYQIFIPNNTSWRSGWVRATAVEEVFSGTVVQPLPDNVVFTQLGTLQTNYTIRSAPNDAASQIGQIVFGGGRFVADQITNGYYRIPVPGASATWGWVKPNQRMIVYPQLTHPSVNVAALPNRNFPITESFSTNATNGKSPFGRPKFNRSAVKSFSPSSPGGDGKALFVTDQSNHGNGTSESVLVGSPGNTNYFVQADVYFSYQPSYLANGAWERSGIFLRDDGFAGLDTTFEGAGNAYVLLWDNDDGRLRAGKAVDATITDFFPTVRTVTAGGWHRMRIEARTNQIRFFLDGQLLVQTNDSNFASGQCGLGYVWHPGSPSVYPAARGVYFDNFVADTLDPVPLKFGDVDFRPDGKVRMTLSSDVGTTNRIEHSSTLATDWTFLTNVINSNSVVDFLDGETNLPNRFYRAIRLP